MQNFCPYKNTFFTINKLKKQIIIKLFITLKKILKFKNK